MTQRVALHHRTAYRYDRPVTLSAQTIRLRPAPHTRTPVHRYALRVSPEPHFLNWQQDPYGNHLARVVFPKPVRELRIEVDLVAELVSFNPFDFFIDPGFEDYPIVYGAELAAELSPFRKAAEGGPLLKKFLASIDGRAQPLIDMLVALNRQVQQAVKYLVRLEPGVQTPEETLRLASGSCRDSAWLLTTVLRLLGYAARFVSGYLVQLTPDQKSLDGPSGAEQDFTDLHAWCEAYLPGAGWVGLDPTSGLLACENHIPLACTAEPGQAAPVSGAVDKCETVFAFSMRIERLAEQPRPTMPYADATWADIDAAGIAVDDLLRHGDVRLTMGGEPTFVGIDLPDAAEWNTTALGPAKLARAEDLARRLHARWAPGGLRHHGQGKWYPGEPLPRWALSSYWRLDGVPLWRDPGRLAEDGVSEGATPAQAQTLARAIAAALDLDDRHAFPAYEDAVWYAWRERRLPINVTPGDPRLDDPVERARLVRTFEQGLDQVVGWVLPVAWRDGWVSGPWFLRREACFLIPGDSPLGYRLPLDGLPWGEPQAHRDASWSDPFSAGGRLPESPRLQLRANQGEQRAAAATPRPGQSADDVVRSALCVEPRQGVLRVFLPPMPDLASFVRLLAAIEDAATACRFRILVEGYYPPRDPRLAEFRVTPDPGVIEANVPPVGSWPELVRRTRELHEEARLARLAAEKFDYDGRHIGSGGGCHIVFGGATPTDSPFLRRPDLLASLLTFWHNHPGLSYAFAGQFIGPTSQATRIDEARNDSVAELELALAQLPAAGSPVPPWLVDRVLRHILADATGNTHRTEFSIDKLFDPAAPGGRLGLVELRSVEMSPHWKMQAAVELLVRGAVAGFWHRPYRRPLVRWGSQLHDRFLLPGPIASDLADALKELAACGVALDPAWYEPHLRFRYPVLGQCIVDGVELELRTGAEPWLTLGEESTTSGQARYVDSSLERIQVRVAGWNPERHLVLVDGWRLPLAATGRAGEAVAGIRYRAWQPPSCLHPTIGVDTPLRIELFDRWSERVTGGVLYHVAHPGGRNHSTRPINANEAEGRRLQRFSAMGQRPGAKDWREPPRSAEAGITLDLRQVKMHPRAWQRGER